MNNIDFTFDAQQIASYELAVVVGNPHSPEGQTQVRLTGRGDMDAKLVHATIKPDPIRLSEDVAEARGKLAPNLMEQLFRLASQLDWNRKFPDRPGIPDEAIVEFVLTIGEVKRLSVKYWLRDAEKDPRCAPVLKELRTELHKASGGRLYL